MHTKNTVLSISFLVYSGKWKFINIMFKRTFVHPHHLEPLHLHFTRKTTITKTTKTNTTTTWLQSSINTSLLF